MAFHFTDQKKKRKYFQRQQKSFTSSENEHSLAPTITALRLNGAVLQIKGLYCHSEISKGFFIWNSGKRENKRGEKQTDFQAYTEVFAASHELSVTGARQVLCELHVFLHRWGRHAFNSNTVSLVGIYENMRVNGKSVCGSSVRTSKTSYSVCNKLALNQTNVCLFKQNFVNAALW